VIKARLPDNFTDEYYLRVIPFLKKIEVVPVTITAATEPEDPTSGKGRYKGAVVWPQYGYTNKKVDETIKDFLKYLQEDRNVKLTDEEIEDINSRKRMLKLSAYSIDREGKELRVGVDFLLGDNGKGEYTREVIWAGIIPDINKKDSIEMTELSNRLASHREK